MKKLFYVLIFLVSVSVPLCADELHFSDGTVIKVHIISVTPSAVEYSVVGGKPFVSTQRSQLSKIVYDDGTAVSLQTESKAVAESSVSQDDQQPLNQQQSLNPQPAGEAPRFDVEAECGWNGYVGTGARLDYRIFDAVSINGGLGAGLWGYRLSCGMRFYLGYPFGAAFGLGIAWNTGSVKAQKQSMETQYPDGTLITEKVSIKYKPAAVINATYLYSFEISDNSKIYIETGYGFPLQKDPYSYTSPSGNRLSKKSKDVMNFMAPGGFIFSVGLAFF